MLINGELAYEINDLKSGYYLVINFEGENKTLDKLNRVYNLSDNVMRSLLLRAE
jgi:small subunit ribosomal protein S6